MNPARSPMVTSTLPSRSASASTSSTTDGSVTTVCTTSTSFMTGAGLKKCIPMTLLGRPVATDSSVTDRLEVLVARIVSGGQTLSSAAKISVLSSMRSGTASITSSACARSSSEVLNRIRPKISSRSAGSSLPRLTARSVECSRWPRPRASASSLTSTAVTDSPARASTSAMPAPMVPSPTTPTSVSSLATLPTPLPYGSQKILSPAAPRPRAGLLTSNQPHGVDPSGLRRRIHSGSEEALRGVVGALEDGVVDGHAVDPPVLRQDPCLRLDLLRGEHALDGGEQRVTVEQLQVAGQLLDAVDLAAPLDLDGDRRPGGVAAQQVDRPDRGRVLAAHQRPAGAEGLHVQRQQPLQLRLDAVLLQAGVQPELVRGVVRDRLDGDDQLLAGLVGDRPRADTVGELVLERAGRAHPVQRLVGAVVGVDRDRPVRLDQQQPAGHREVGGEPPDVVDRAAGDDQTHGARRYLARAVPSPACRGPVSRLGCQGPDVRHVPPARGDRPGDGDFLPRRRHQEDSRHRSEPGPRPVRRRSVIARSAAALAALLLLGACAQSSSGGGGGSTPYPYAPDQLVLPGAHTGGILTPPVLAPRPPPGSIHGDGPGLPHGPPPASYP